MKITFIVQCLLIYTKFCRGESYFSKEALLYFDEMQNVNLLISKCRLMSTAQNNSVQDLHYVLRFVKVKQQTLSHQILNDMI